MKMLSGMGENMSGRGESVYSGNGGSCVALTTVIVTKDVEVELIDPVHGKEELYRANPLDKAAN